MTDGTGGKKLFISQKEGKRPQRRYTLERHTPLIDLLPPTRPHLLISHSV
jgi:hypothetical protein